MWKIRIRVKFDCLFGTETFHTEAADVLAAVSNALVLFRGRQELKNTEVVGVSVYRLGPGYAEIQTEFERGS